MPFVPQANTTGLLSKIFKNGINWSTILTNTQKTLNIINQTIPVIKQAKPVITNAKTVFKIMNEFKKVETPKNKKQEKQQEKLQEKREKYIKNQNNNPVFFV